MTNKPEKNKSKQYVPSTQALEAEPQSPLNPDVSLASHDWVAIKALNLSYYIGGTILNTIYLLVTPNP